jgi:hypothetical protein
MIKLRYERPYILLNTLITNSLSAECHLKTEIILQY